MVKEITLPLTSEVCDKIKDVFLNILLISGPLALGFGIYEEVSSHEVLYSFLGLLIAVYGLIFTFMFFICYGEIISDFYDEHKIVFKCSCKQQSSEVVN